MMEAGWQRDLQFNEDKESLPMNGSKRFLEI